MIHLQPNPAHGMLRFIAGPPAAECWIVDVLGRRVGSAEMASQQGDATFDTSGLPTGTYYIVYEADGAHGSLKFRKD
jgi:hypothetical protein